jgi:hypothetical protein
MTVNVPDWILDLKGSIREWIKGLMVPGEPFGRFRYAKEGCVHLPYDIISVHSAAHVYERLRLDRELTEEQLRQWKELSLSWRDPATGEVSDPDGLEKGLPDNDDLAVSVTALRRNLNRCMAGVLGAAKAKPVLQKDVKIFTQDIKKMYDAFDAEAWDTDAWGAGAHCAHYIGAMRQWRDAGHLEFNKPIEKAVEYLYSRQRADTGAFCGDEQGAPMIIGGILKIYNQLFGYMDLEIRYPEKIIDTTMKHLKAGELNYGLCPGHNAMILFLMCGNFTDYRKNEIRQETAKAFEDVFHARLMDDGAFCSDPEQLSKSIWGVKMFEHDKLQSDLHGTLIMLQAIIVAAELLDQEDKLDYEPSGWKKI